MYAEKIIDRRKKEREHKNAKVTQKQYAHKGGKKPTDLYQKDQKSEKSVDPAREMLSLMNTDIIEELSEECASSHNTDDSYLFAEPFGDRTNFSNRKNKKSEEKKDRKKKSM